MSAIRIIEDRIQTLNHIPETNGNEEVIKLFKEYLESLKNEILLEGDSSMEPSTQQEREVVEDRIANLKLVPLPW
jgi:hypothetical protein